MSTPEAVRAYAEARIDALNRAITPLIDEKRTLQRVLDYLPPAEPAAITEKLKSMAQQDPSVRAALAPILQVQREETPVEEAVSEIQAPISPESFLTAYRQDLFAALPRVFTKADILAWVIGHNDSGYSMAPGAVTSRARDALASFRRYGLVKDRPEGKYSKNVGTP